MSEIFSVVMESFDPYHNGGPSLRLFSTRKKAAKCACEWIKEYIGMLDEDYIGISYEPAELDKVLGLIKTKEYEKAYGLFSRIADYDVCPQIKKEKVY